jgi:type I restriction enzyme R subunit
MKQADHERKQIESFIAELNNFKSGLARFSRTYAYIAQLIALGDPELENFAAFTKLLSKRLDGVPPDQVDLRGITLTGYDIVANPQGQPGGDEDDDENDIVLRPVGAGGGDTTGKTPLYLQELIERLNGIFGEAAPIEDQAAFVNQIAAITRENGVVAAQVAENSKDQALKGNLPGAVQQAVVRAMMSNTSLATLLLKEDRQGIEMLTSMIYDMLKSGKAIDLNAFLTE